MTLIEIKAVLLFPSAQLNLHLKCLSVEIRWGVAGNQEALLSVHHLVHIVKSQQVTFGSECKGNACHQK